MQDINETLLVLAAEAAVAKAEEYAAITDEEFFMAASEHEAMMYAANAYDMDAEAQVFC
jgi:hypothetical protein